MPPLEGSPCEWGRLGGMLLEVLLLGVMTGVGGMPGMLGVWGIPGVIGIPGLPMDCCCCKVWTLGDI